jgi:hypothetical protein
VLCVVSSLLGLLIELINELVANFKQTQTYTLFNVLTLALGAAAVVLGLFALATQIRRWSLHKRNLLLIGFPAAILTLVSVAPNFFDNPAFKVTPQKSLAEAPARTPAQTNAVAQTNAAQAQNSDAPVDDALVKPGWYGELRLDNALLIVSSYEENAFESRQFNGRLFKPVSYATLSVINLGSSVPLALSTFQASAYLDSGDEIRSLAIEPLLSQNASANRDLLKRLALPRTLGIGEMLSDVPICMESGFSWSRVVAVKVAVGAQDVLIPGRVMTADEKRKALDNYAGSSPAPNTSGAGATSSKTP